jgi:hypothetical protein
MMKKIFFAFLSLMLLVSFTGMTHTIHYCKMKMAKMQNEAAEVCDEEMVDTDDCCADEAPAIPDGQPVIEKKIEECCVTSVAGVPLQYDSPAPDGKQIISPDIVLIAEASPVIMPLVVSECSYNAPLHPPPRDIPVLFSNLLI